MTTQSLQQRNGRSLFWPLILIGAGLVWLLTNVGILQPASLNILFRLWPVILIVLGLNLLLGRRSPAVGTLIGLGGVAVVILLMLVGPSLGWAKSAEVKTASYEEAVGDAQSAHISLDLSVADTTVKALTDSNDLFQADLTYIGDLDYEVVNEPVKTISLRQVNESNGGIRFLDWNFWDHDQKLNWDIGLSKNVPLDLDVTSGVSNSTLDLQDLDLTSLHVNSGVGSTELTLPAMQDSYTVDISGGAGSTNITVEEGTTVDFTIQGGVGSVTVDVPEGAAVRVEASTGVGSVNVPTNFASVSGDTHKFVGEDGVWESAGFENSDRPIVIHYEDGVGTLTVK
ncbi:MAG: DUF5668 domain-containing protein [Chloroflexota bacterium]